MTESSDRPSGEVGGPGGSPEAAPPYTYPPGPYPPGPYPPAPQPYWAFRPTPAAPRNGLGIASLVIGILALSATWTVVGGIFLAVFAVIFGGVALAKVRRGEATNGGVAIAGIVLGIVAAVVAVIIGVVLALVLGSDVFNENYQHCIGYHPGDEQACEQYR
ncbi:MAG: DUF4190 domain-containing protein [Mycobacterium sp.]